MKNGAEVYRPSHYDPESTYEPLKVIRAWGLGFELGNVLKYLARAGRKPGATRLEDLQKAATYLALEIEKEEASGAKMPLVNPVPKKLTPYNEGHIAGYAKKPSSSCPYDDGTESARQWNAGYLDGLATRTSMITKGLYRGTVEASDGQE
jgi:ribosome modulation factor